jgi:D,D-heptose 1,7-bisphosphate phosphatase
LLVHPNDHPLDSDLIEVNAEDWIEAFRNRPHPTDRWFQNLVNAGLYVLRKAALAPWAGSVARLDFGHDLFPAMLRRGTRLLAYNSAEYIKDIGTPERYDRISDEHQRGVVARCSLRTPQRAVFLDRDGTLVPDKDCLRRAEDLELLPGVAEAIRQLNHHGWRAVLATNQPVVAKGWCTEAELQRIHNKLETLLGREHAFLDRIYFCPHHPEGGFAGERADLKIHCQCRKPAPGMLLQAAADLNLDLAQCWLVGDSTVDLQAAVNGGVRPVLVRTGNAGRDGRYPAAPHFVFDTLGQSVDFIVRNAAVPTQ